VDIVGLDNRQRPVWCVEVTRSDGALWQANFRNGDYLRFASHP